MERRTTDIAPRGCRHGSGRAAPSNEGRRGGEDEAVVARSADELGRRGKAVLRGAARERERRPAERVEREGEAGHRVAVPVRDPAELGRDEGERRRQQEVEALEELETALPVALSLAGGELGLALAHGQTLLLELLPHVLAVRVGVLGE